VSSTLLPDCALHVHIPMLGVKSSLNVAVAFGIAAFAIGRALAPRVGARPLAESAAEARR
jgi:tRNA G18 (ribose-2'-O)-methylase SpoU